MAETLARLGAERAWLAHGRDGTDEISICGPTDIVELRDGELRQFTIEPGDAGLPQHEFSSITGGSPENNAAALRSLLDGERSAYRDAVLLNAAAALVIADAAANLREGVEIGRGSIDSGNANARARQLAEVTAKSAA